MNRGGKLTYMPQLRVADLLAASPVDPTAHVDDERVAELAGSRDPRPPGGRLRDRDRIAARRCLPPRCDDQREAPGVCACPRGGLLRVADEAAVYEGRLP